MNADILLWIFLAWLIFTLGKIWGRASLAIAVMQAEDATKTTDSTSTELTIEQHQGQWYCWAEGEFLAQSTTVEGLMREIKARCQGRDFRIPADLAKNPEIRAAAFNTFGE